MAFLERNGRGLLWFAVALAVIAFFFTVVYIQSRPGPAEQIALKAQRLELVHAVRTALAAVSEAQNSAVMSSADEDIRYFVAQAQRASTDLDRGLKELEDALTAHGNEQQSELMNGVKRAFAEFQRLDKQLLELSIQNSNRKAYALAIGPAAKVLEEIDAILSRVAEVHQKAPASSDLQIVQLANETRIGVLRTQVLLLPHIAEEQDDRMDELEAQIAQEDQKITKNMESLSELLPASDRSDVGKVQALYADFAKLKAQTLKLSRENTNVKSLSLTLNEKRQAMLAVEDSLAALEHAIESEEVATTIPLRR